MKNGSSQLATRLPAFATFAAALALLALPGCTPEVPANPTYTKDVQPILIAHCVRCHGANDMLNAIPGIKATSAMPAECYLQRYESEPPGCTPGGTCKAGAGYCAGLLPTYINSPDNGPLRMPPPPADPLSQWEKDVINRWAAVMPPAN